MDKSQNILARHGVGTSGGIPKGASSLKMTASLTEPLNPSKYDIWIKTDQPLTNLHLHADTVDDPQELKAYLAVGSSPLFKINVAPTTEKIEGLDHISEINIYYPETMVYNLATDDFLPAWKSSYLELWIRLGPIKYWDDLNVVWNFCNAYYWTGTSWFMFSSPNYKLIALYIDNNLSIYNLDGTLHYQLNDIKTNKFNGYWINGFPSRASYTHPYLYLPYYSSNSTDISGLLGTLKIHIENMAIISDTPIGDNNLSQNSQLRYNLPTRGNKTPTLSSSTYVPSQSYTEVSIFPYPFINDAGYSMAKYYAPFGTVSRPIVTDLIVDDGVLVFYILRKEFTNYYRWYLIKQLVNPITGEPIIESPHNIEIDLDWQKHSLSGYTIDHSQNIHIMRTNQGSSNDTTLKTYTIHGDLIASSYIPSYRSGSSDYYPSILNSLSLDDRIVIYCNHGAKSTSNIIFTYNSVGVLLDEGDFVVGTRSTNQHGSTHELCVYPNDHLFIVASNKIYKINKNLSIIYEKTLSGIKGQDIIQHTTLISNRLVW